MQKEDILKYIDNPEKLNEYSLSELRAMIKRYPYFQMSYALFIVNLKNIKDPRFEEFLKQYSVFTKDRNQLFRYINYIERILAGQPAEEAKEGPNIKEETVDKEQQDAGRQEDKETATGKEQKEKIDKEAEDPGPRKRTEERKKKQYTRKYLGDRISETLTNQINEADKKDKLDEEVNTEFFILDKTSKVKDKPDNQNEPETTDKKEEFEQTGSEEIGEAFELDDKSESKPVEEKKGRKERKNQGYASSQYFNENYLAYKSEDGQEDLIDNFIKNDPEPAIKSPEGSEQKDISQESVQEHEDLLSEKLVEVYIQQGYYYKAIEAFKKLSLKYPEKSDYFAERIKKVKQIINEQ
jgi:hypothetical protein